MIVLHHYAKAGVLVGSCMFSVSGSACGLIMVMIPNNSLGYTKKATVNSLQVLPCSAENWIGPRYSGALRLLSIS